jgi:Zn-dependent protease with chaperone function
VNIAIYLPLLMALPLTLGSGRLAARGAPDLIARALAGFALIAAVSSTWSLILLALTLLDDLPPLSALDDHPTLEPPEPVPGPVALVAAVLLVWGGVRLIRDVRLRTGTHRRLRTAGSPQHDLVVADWSAPMAVAVPGRPGHVLVTSGILRLLDADEQRVLFAHERAHLAHRHNRLVSLTAASAAVNPLLIPVRRTVAYLVERWADEEAATVVSDRALTAQTVARAALATVASGPEAALGMHGGTAVHRVQALIAPSPAPRRRRLVGPLLLAAGSLAASAVATAEFVALARAWL